MIADFAVADAAQCRGGRRATGGEEGAHLVDEAAPHHVATARVEPLAEPRSRQVQTDDAHRQLISAKGMLGLPARDRDAGQAVYLEGADDAGSVVGVQAARRHGIDRVELAVQSAGARRVARNQLGAQRRVARRPGKQAVAHGLEIEAGAADQQSRPPARGDRRDLGARQRRVARAVERLGGLDDIEQMVRRAGPQLRARLGAADVEAAVDLARIAVDDLAADQLGDADRQLGFAAAGRADDGDDGRAGHAFPTTIGSASRLPRSSHASRSAAGVAIRYPLR